MDGQMEVAVKGHEICTASEYLIECQTRAREMPQSVKHFCATSRT